MLLYFKLGRYICLLTLAFSQMIGVSHEVGLLEKSPTEAVENAQLYNANHNNRFDGKPVFYQVFTRLFGNKKTRNKPWGTLEENGVGKFNDFNDKALNAITELGVTHIWYTGVLHHALATSYVDIGVTDDDPDVIKGRAGSPYAIKDYYNVNPDLAVNPKRRLEEFQALVNRSHQHGLKVIIDIVPNHVARAYQSVNNSNPFKPKGIVDFGDEDDRSLAYHRNNNFYYVIDHKTKQGVPFEVPQSKNNYRPLNGGAHPLSDGRFAEFPAKWTGNGSRLAQPNFDDWYETVRINYGVKPDGSKDFPELPPIYSTKNIKEHYEFWKDKDVPNSWKKMREIVEYWLDFGVDGFRYDVAELVPTEFWSYLNSAIKIKNSNSTLIAEVYNPLLYRDFIYLGKMDYLYDKVDFYDLTRDIMKGKATTDELIKVQNKYHDIEQHLLHFLENHDEHRVASVDFIGKSSQPQTNGKPVTNPVKKVDKSIERALLAKPAMVVLSTISRSPTMIYFGQEVGEAGQGDAGFGNPGRTSIFDYWGVKAHQRWMNEGAFDGGALSEEEKKLRQFYSRLLNFTRNEPALRGSFLELHSANLERTENYSNRVISYTRFNQESKFIIVSNYDSDKTFQFSLLIPKSLNAVWALSDGEYMLNDKLSKDENTLVIEGGIGRINIMLAPLESVIYQVGEQSSPL